MGVSNTRHKVIIEKGREFGYGAYVPALKGCVSQGDTHEAALANIKEAAEVYVEALLEDHIPLPPEVEIGELDLEVA